MIWERLFMEQNGITWLSCGTILKTLAELSYWQSAQKPIGTGLHQYHKSFRRLSGLRRAPARYLGHGNSRCYS